MAAAVVAVAPRGKQLDHFDAECDAVVKEAANLVRAAFYHMPPQIPPGPPKDPNKPRCNIGAKFKGGLLDVAKEAVDFLDEVKKILPPEVTARGDAPPTPPPPSASGAAVAVAKGGEPAVASSRGPNGFGYAYANQQMAYAAWYPWGPVQTPPLPPPSPPPQAQPPPPPPPPVSVRPPPPPPPVSVRPPPPPQPPSPPPAPIAVPKSDPPPPPPPPPKYEERWQFPDGQYFVPCPCRGCGATLTAETANFLGVVPRGVTRRKEAMADVDRRPGHAYCRNCFMDRTEGRIVKEFVKKGASKRNVRFVWTEPNQVYVDRATVAVVPAKRKSKKKAKKKSKSSSSSSSAREVAHIVTVVAPQPEPAAKEKKPLFRNRLFKVNPNPDKALPPQKKK